MAKSKYRVCVVDDDSAVCEAIRKGVRPAGYETITYASAADFLKTYDPFSMGCLVLEMRLPGMSGLDLQDILKARKNPISIIFLTGHADVPQTVQAMTNGALDVMQKPLKMPVVLNGIQQAMALKAKWRKLDQERQKIALRRESLTRRETEVMELMADGLKNKEIAKHLGICRKTLDIHRTKVMGKMKSRTWADITRWHYLHESGFEGKIILKPGGYV